MQVATIDGNLTKGDHSGDDGQSVLAAIRKVAPHVKTIGLSGNSVEGVDLDLGAADIIYLGRTVTNI